MIAVTKLVCHAGLCGLSTEGKRPRRNTISPAEKMASCHLSLKAHLVIVNVQSLAKGYSVLVGHLIGVIPSMGRLEA